MKYRVIYEYSLYYPQVKSWFPWPRWHEVSWDAPSCHTLEEALADIEMHKKVFGKDRKKKNIVWESEDE